MTENSREVKHTILRISSYLVKYLTSTRNLDRDAALELLIKTALYEALMDPESGLYLESKESVCARLDDELNGNQELLLVV